MFPFKTQCSGLFFNYSMILMVFLVYIPAIEVNKL